MDLKNIETPLAKWAVKQKLTPTDLAAKLGVSYSTILNWTREFTSERYVQPPLPMQREIFLLTKGEVKPNDLVPLPAWQAELERGSMAAEGAEAAQ